MALHPKGNLNQDLLVCYLPCPDLSWWWIASLNLALNCIQPRFVFLWLSDQTMSSLKSRMRSNTDSTDLTPGRQGSAITATSVFAVWLIHFPLHNNERAFLGHAVMCFCCHLKLCPKTLPTAFQETRHSPEGSLRRTDFSNCVLNSPSYLWVPIINSHLFKEGILVLPPWVSPTASSLRSVVW